MAALAALGIAITVAPIMATVALAADPIVTVKRGDTLSGIAKTHGVDMATIVALNGLPDPNRIFAGQQLRVGADPRPATPATPATAAAATHVVARGENLTRIANHYGVTVAEIVADNGIANPSRIFAGQRLAIPGVSPAAAAPAAAPAQQPAAAPAEHVIARGETLTGIARHYGATVAAIVAANGIANPSRVFAGQRIVIPAVAAAASAPAPASPASPPAMPESMAAKVAQRDAVRQLIAEEATRYGVPVAFALAVAWQESGWQQHAVSSAGAIGVMQLMPATAEWVGSAMLGHAVQIDDARHNVRAGVRLLAHYLARYAGNRDLVLAAYYQGQSAADRHGIYPVSVPYIGSITRLERLFGG
jgi:LysM repeat protein